MLFLTAPFSISLDLNTEVRAPSQKVYNFAAWQVKNGFQQKQGESLSRFTDTSAFPGASLHVGTLQRHFGGASDLVL